MSLDWNIEGCAEHEKMSYKDDDGVFTLMPITERIVWYAGVALGIPCITEKTKFEFLGRAYEYDSIGDAGTRYGFLTLADVEKHIGLKTNGTRKTRAKFDADLRFYQEREKRMSAKREEKTNG